MHELSIAQNIVNIVLEQMKVHSLSKIENVMLKVGTLRGVSVESLMFCFDVAVKETPMEGAKLVIETVPIRGRCITCNQEFTIEHWLDDCPFCSSHTVEITSGKELEIAGIEVT
jgi:hydrogenase nickel incorporation protein HypA/HybF